MSIAILDVVTNLSSRLEKMSEEMAEVKALNFKMDKKIDEQAELLKQTEEIKGRLTAVFNRLEEMERTLERRKEEATKFEDRIKKLKERLANLLAQDINVTTLMEETERIQREIELIMEQPQDGDMNINESLKEMNGKVHEVQVILSKLKDQQRLSEAIEKVKQGFGSTDLERLAKGLGFSNDEISKIRCFAPGYLVPQISELFRLWREKNGINATVDALEQACRSSGHSRLAGMISSSGTPLAATGTSRQLLDERTRPPTQEDNSRRGRGHPDGSSSTHLPPIKGVRRSLP
ncbi:uncharacterized protein LOC144925168 [Branchiostoma floridae x Branchiostoma belcheri]